MLLPIFLQFKIVFFAILAGILTGILFDFYRVIRGYGVIKIVKIIEDILFWILCSLVVFTFLLYTNYAFLGIYVYLFIGIGAILYLNVFSHKIFKIEKNIGRSFLKGIRIVGKNISYGARLIFNNKENNK
ncbi:MAG: spore cortex biosynthesis protein YabQ [Sarcina sp.]